MSDLLAGDIGGTKTILRLLAGRQVVLERRYASAEYADLAPIVLDFLQAAAAEQGAAPSVRAACFAIAGPVDDEACRVTNLPWVLHEARLEAELRIPNVRLINDFAAVGFGIPALEPGDLRTLQEGDPDPAAPIAVLGAGTGLGQGFLLPANGGHKVFPSEGGHADFAPRSAREFRLLSYLREAHGLTRVSVERVVSGSGIVSIYEFLRRSAPDRESPAMAATYARYLKELGRDDKTIDLAAEISKAAMAGKDFLSQETMDLFVSAYGAEAGNLALKLLPYGGLYVAGGITGKILPLLERGVFLEALREKGRMRPLVEKVPVHLVINPRVGLLGAARHAATLAGELEEVAR